MSAPINVTVSFSQNGEHKHTWEADTSGLEISRMVEAACCSGLVEDDQPLDYIVFDDDQQTSEEVVLMEGSIKPAYLNLSNT